MLNLFRRSLSCKDILSVFTMLLDLPKCNLRKNLLDLGLLFNLLYLKETFSKIVFIFGFSSKNFLQLLAVASPEHTTLANQAFNCILGAQFLDDPFRFCFPQIGEVAMNKKFSRLKANNIVRRDLDI